MPAPKGHARYGGRKAGTPNKQTKTLMEKCEARGFDIWEAMMDLANDPADKNIRLSALREMLKYVYPQRKATEITAQIDQKIADRVKELEQMSDEELKKIVEEKKE